jgi:hypothetical protein
VCWPFKRKARIEPAIQKLSVSFCFDLTKPDAPTMEVGTLRVQGDRFVDFTWTVDPEGLAAQLPPFTRTMILSLPRTLSSTADTWLPFKNRAVPEWRKKEDPKTLAEYYCHTLRHSSVVISDYSREAGR